MKLIVKFNLVLFLIFAFCFTAAEFMADNLLQRDAKQQIVENARIMAESALAVRAYTNTQIKPLLAPQLKYRFLPQSVPAFSANEYFASLRKKFPDYSYKEATLNPTNPVNRANDWEAEIIRHFRQSPQQTELVGERETPNGRVLYVAHPMPIKDAGCLECHDTPKTAPKALVERYGNANGFGWKLNDLRTAQIVSAPMELPMARARQVSRIFMASLGGVFLLMIVGVNVMLIFLVVRPVGRLSKTAHEVSLGNMKAPEFRSNKKDEIGRLAGSFNRMRKSLAQAINMLDAESA